MDNNKVSTLYFINSPLPMNTTVPLNASSGTIVYKLKAGITDAEHDIHYFLIKDRTRGRFEVDEQSGEVRTVGSEPFMLDKEYVLYVRAEDRKSLPLDKKFQSTKLHRLSIMGGRRPPSFYKTRYNSIIPENLAIDSVIIKVKAKSFSDRNISYVLKGMTKEVKTDNFEIDSTSGIVKLVKEVDYEKVKEYPLYVKAIEENTNLSFAVELTIKVIDINDEIPIIIDNKDISVLEGMPSGTKVTQIHAIDRDDTYPNNKVYYAIDGNNEYFSIDRETGVIYTKIEFDRELIDTYNIVVRAEDGSPSQRLDMNPKEPNSVKKSICINISDVNDNPPYFDRSLYEVEIPEDMGIGHKVITVLAKDRDESKYISYAITRGNYNETFYVYPESGTIFVGKRLDYKTRKQFKLSLVASDYLHENYTTIVINIKQVNKTMI